MRNTIWKRIGALVLVLALVMGTVLVPSYGASDVSDLLTGKTVEITQDGVTVSDFNLLDPEKGFDIKLSFGVPVAGDGGSGPFVEKGDTASFQIAKGFKITGSTSFTLKQGEKEVGTLTLTSAGTGKDTIVKADVVFDGNLEVFDGSEGWKDIVCTFTANLEYDGPGRGDSEAKYDIEILESKYEITVPELPVVLDGSKQGTRDGKFIDWVVEVDPKKGSSPGDISGYTFKDNLASVGDYDPGSFRIGTTNVYSAATPETPVFSGSEMSYEFPTGTIGPTYLFFRTEISNTLFFDNGAKSITNKAEIFDGTVNKYTESDTVNFTVEWIEKEGAKTYTDGTNAGKITWSIIANQLEATLPGAVITDVLSDELIWESATLQLWDGSAWGTATSLSNPGPSGEYNLGTINTKVLLTITADIDITKINIGHEIHTITNDAKITWTEYPGPGTGINTGSVGVGIGFNPISKEKGTGGYDKVSHEIPWKVTVKKSDVNVNLYVLDLLVYGTSLDINSVNGMSVKEQSGALSTDSASLINTTALSVANIKALNPKAEYNQRFEGSFSSNPAGSLGYVVYTLTVGGKPVADLLAVARNDGASIDVLSGDKSFSFNSKVTNPNFYAGDGDKTINNSAVLYSANTKINESQASETWTSLMLIKDMLLRGDGTDPDGKVNAGAASESNAYNYQDHSIVYRLYVNANNLNFNGDITADPSKFIGNIKLVDTLPSADWEFAEVDPDYPGEKFLIYDGNPSTVTTGGKFNTTGSRLGSATYSSFLTADFTTDTTKVDFTFTALNKPYVILLRAKIKDDKVDEYFKTNGTYEPINTAKITAENWPDGVEKTRKETIISNIVTKNSLKVADGIVKWTVEYRPNKTKRLNATITDTLPPGLEIRTDSSGQLIIPGNITAMELNLQPNGTYADGAPVTLTLNTDVSYDNSNRKLEFKITDPEKAYRFTYITDITETINGTTLKNKVELASGSYDDMEIEGGYLVATADASATMSRSGWMEITKKDGKDNSNIAGVGFTLYASDGITVMRTGTTDASGKLAFRALPVGSYKLKETGTLSTYHPDLTVYDVVVDSSFVTSVNGQTGSDSHKITLKNFKKALYGDLTISKTVNGIAAVDNSKLFTFKVEIAGLNGNFDYDGLGGKAGGQVVFTSGVSSSIILKHGESIRIKYLPKDETYTVTENSYESDGYTTSSSGATGTIIVDDVVNANFINTKDGWIEVTKVDAADSSKLSGATFVLYGSDKTTVVDTKISDSSGIARFLNILEGTYYLRETIAPTGYENQHDGLYYVVVVDDSGITKIDGGFHKLEVKNYKNSTVGKLEIKKVAEGTNKEAGKEYEFNINIASLTGSFPYTGSGGKASGNITFTAGSADFTLKDGEGIVISYLPAGSFTLTETDYSGSGYVTSYNGTIGRSVTNNVVADSTITYTFKNSRTGWLTLTKEDIADGTKLSGAEFTLFKSDKTTVEAVGTTDLSGNLSFYDLEVGTYYLRETGAPAGYTYQWGDKNIGDIEYEVKVELSGGNIITSIDGTPGNLKTFKNYKDGTVGDLLITKTLSGNATDPTKDFEFTLSMPSEWGKSYAYIHTDVSGIKTDRVASFDSSGDFDFTLKGKESIYIKYLPATFLYTITEKDYTGDRYTTASLNDTGSIIADDIIYAEFENKKSNPSPIKTGSINLSKVVSGEGGEKDKKFNFTVTFSKENENFVYSGPGIPTSFIKSGGTISLSHGQSVTIVGLPEGTEYTITEEDYSGEGYKATSVNRIGKISGDTILKGSITFDKRNSLG